MWGPTCVSMRSYWSEKKCFERGWWRKMKHTFHAQYTLSVTYDFRENPKTVTVISIKFYIWGPYINLSHCLEYVAARHSRSHILNITSTSSCPSILVPGHLSFRLFYTTHSLVAVYPFQSKHQKEKRSLQSITVYTQLNATLLKSHTHITPIYKLTHNSSTLPHS